MSNVAVSSVTDHLFDDFNAACQRQFDETAGLNTPVFTTEGFDLYQTYLDGFEELTGDRQHHTCHCCRQFIERFGSLAVIGADGELQSAICNSEMVPAAYKPVVAKLERAIRRSKVTGVFLVKEKVWGTPEAGGWSHFAIRVAAERVFRDRLLTPFQAMAQKKQDFGTLSHGLAEFKLDVVNQALNLLETEDTLYRSEKVIGPARFLAELHTKLDEAPYRDQRSNLIWKAVATAPVGYATPRSSMIGTLLEDIAAGKSLSAIKSSFAAKMDPLQYQRPQAPAKAGNIEQAEKIVEKLGIQNSLRRRFATLDEMNVIWSPRKQKPAETGGVFGHLKSQVSDESVKIVTKGSAITWVKFASTVLPKAERIQVRTERTMNFCGVLTAVDPSAPPILQWDHEEKRNLVSWYVYSGGSSPSQWGLSVGKWVDCPGIMLKPSMQDGENAYPHLGKGAILILEGCRESRPNSLGLFPEILKSELHQIRATIEAFSKAGQAEGADEGSANGLLVGERGSNFVIRVTTALGVSEYRIDRWD